MTNEELIAMALEVGFKRDNCGIYQPDRMNPDADCTPLLEAFARLVAAKEREACAEVCELVEPRISSSATYECAAAIRKRGE